MWRNKELGEEVQKVEEEIHKMGKEKMWDIQSTLGNYRTYGLKPDCDKNIKYRTWDRN